ncbi:MAG: hypothetical protein GC199_11595 [Alphaproteobacteria bacterium]|nr:hypothetical protein [Alphaproteobacteria bacterium]
MPNSLSIAVFLLALGTAACAAEPDLPDGPISVSAVSVPIAPNDPDTDDVGALEYRGGLVLSSPDARFGGYSGLLVAPDGSSLLTVSDRGYWLKADLTYLHGRLSDVTHAETALLWSENGQANRWNRDYDAEALTWSGEPGDFSKVALAFEQRHRIALYDFAEEGFSARPAETLLPTAFVGQPGNGGIESLVRFPDGRFLAISEDALDEAGNTRAWLVTPPVDDEEPQTETLATRRIEPFAPTDAALLPSGDLLVVERRFSPMAGVGMQLRRIARDTIAPGAVLDGPVLANLAMSYSIDNMEGLAVREGKAGETLIYLIADDNFNTPIQRTMLLMFALKEP